MLLQKRLVKLLKERNERCSEFPTFENFVSFIVERRWPRFNYIFDTNEEYRLRIRTTLEDLIGSDPGKHFIDYAEDKEGTKPRQSLKVTAYGRFFISPFGFVQVIGEKFNRVWYLVGAVVTFLIGKYWNKIIEFIK